MCHLLYWRRIQLMYNVTLLPKHQWGWYLEPPSKHSTVNTQTKTPKQWSNVERKPPPRSHSVLSTSRPVRHLAYPFSPLLCGFPLRHVHSWKQSFWGTGSSLYIPQWPKSILNTLGALLMCKMVERGSRSSVIGTDRDILKKHKPRAGNNLPLRSTEGSLLLRTFVNICFLKATQQTKLATRLSLLSTKLQSMPKAVIHTEGGTPWKAHIRLQLQMLISISKYPSPKGIIKVEFG